MDADVITVGRLTVNCTVARDHPNIERVRWRLGEIADAPLRLALADLLAPLASLGGDEVVVIRRLVVSFDLDTSREVSDLARRWASRLAAGLARSFEAGSRTTAMLRFPDRAHYLSRFLIDATSGRAAGKWYYRGFRGLAALSIPATLRTALLEDAGRGLAALRVLEAGDLVSVLEALGSLEARRVVETIAAGADDGAGPEAAAETLLPVVAAWHALPLVASPRWASALALLAFGSVDVAPPRLPSVARLAVALATWMEAPTGPTTVPHAATIDAAPGLAPLLALSPARRERIVVALGRKAADRSTAAAPPARTPYGGLVLLLRHLPDMPFDEIWSDPRDRAIARLVILARCAGGARSGRVTLDPVLGELCGLPSREPTLPVADWVNANREALPRLAATLAADRRAQARSVRLAVARVPGQDRLFVRIADPEGYWVGLEPLSASLPAALRPGDAAVTAPPEVSRDSRLSTVRALTRVLSYLAPPDGSIPAVEADLALAQAAQHVLRAFARRLPGFGESSPAFLYDNFLAFPATLERDGERRACRMGRPPLAALLEITGALRGSIALPWLDVAALELYSGG